MAVAVGARGRCGRREHGNSPYVGGCTQAADILQNLCRRVLIPPAVKAELVHANTPAIVRAWISQPPSWLEVWLFSCGVSPVISLSDLLSAPKCGQNDYKVGSGDLNQLQW